ncbi:nitroreductase/quinone reductase family protein [Nonomuraea dietziae]|uniref:nitroreductase/quinone reductase family protein n=1 Tax=Nonomuraea dietziae TaxID=65515 RepID=UPI0031D8A924
MSDRQRALPGRESEIPMPMPLWWGHVNKRVFNPLTIARGKSPVLTHVGRVSGATYRTPLDAHPVDGGYLFILVYGSRSEWVQNVLAAGGARLQVDGREVELAAPRLVVGGRGVPGPLRRGGTPAEAASHHRVPSSGRGHRLTVSVSVAGLRRPIA